MTRIRVRAQPAGTLSIAVRRQRPPATSRPRSTTVTALAPGSAVTLDTSGTTANNFSWASVTAGTDGSNGCSSSTVGTFVNSNTNTTLAGNLATAITNCHNSFSAVNATATQGTGGNTNQTIVTDFTPGTGPTLTVLRTSSVFSWGTVSAGADGSTACPTLAT